MWVAYKKTLFTKGGLPISRVGIDQLIFLAVIACVKQWEVIRLLQRAVVAESICINIAFRSLFRAGRIVWAILPTAILATPISWWTGAVPIWFIKLVQ